MLIRNLLSLFLAVCFLAGCAHHPTSLKQPQKVDIDTRQQQLSAINQWTIKGKIGFIQKSNREKATIHWQYNSDTGNQTLKLTTYLGINVLTLNTTNGVHTLSVDGNTYQTHSLEQLVWQLTQLTLPLQALPLWIKGLPYTNSDNIIREPISLLPQTITSQYNLKNWQINYRHYQNVQGIFLAHNIEIKQENLTIKLIINDWQFNR